MPREIEFRGKTKDGKWVYGYFVNSNGYLIHEGGYGGIWTVIPESVGQYTGLKDSKGQKIYEGDVLKIYGEDIVKVFFKNGVFGFDGEYWGFDPFDEFHTPNLMEVIGNVIDNPELLKEE